MSASPTTTPSIVPFSSITAGLWVGLDRFASIFFSFSLTASALLEQQNPQQNILKQPDCFFFSGSYLGVSSYFTMGDTSYCFFAFLICSSLISNWFSSFSNSKTDSSSLAAEYPLTPFVLLFGEPLFYLLKRTTMKIHLFDIGAFAILLCKCIWFLVFSINSISATISVFILITHSCSRYVINFISTY